MLLIYIATDSYSAQAPCKYPEHTFINFKLGSHARFGHIRGDHHLNNNLTQLFVIHTYFKPSELYHSKLRQLQNESRNSISQLNVHVWRNPHESANCMTSISHISNYTDSAKPQSTKIDNLETVKYNFQELFLCTTTQDERLDHTSVRILTHQRANATTKHRSYAC